LKKKRTSSCKEPPLQFLFNNFKHQTPKKKSRRVFVSAGSFFWCCWFFLGGFVVSSASFVSLRVASSALLFPFWSLVPVCPGRPRSVGRLACGAWCSGRLSASSLRRALCRCRSRRGFLCLVSLFGCVPWFEPFVSFAFRAVPSSLAFGRRRGLFP